MADEALRAERWEREIADRTFRRHLLDQKAYDRQLRRILMDAAREADRLAQAAIPDNIGARLRQAQYRQSSFMIRQAMDDAWADIGRVIAQGVDASATLAAEATMLVNEVLANSLSTQALSRSMLESARRSIEDVRSRIVNDISLSDRVYRNAALTRGQVDGVVNRGIALRRSAREIARDVARFIRPNTPGGVSYAAMRLGRTELNNAFHTTTVRSIEDMPWIEGVLWVTSGSHPRPDECDDYANGDHDGLGKGVFQKDHVPGKPHPQCLCHVVTISVGIETFTRRYLAGDYDDYLSGVGIHRS